MSAETRDVSMVVEDEASAQDLQRRTDAIKDRVAKIEEARQSLNLKNADEVNEIYSQIRQLDSEYSSIKRSINDLEALDGSGRLDESEKQMLAEARAQCDHIKEQIDRLNATASDLMSHEDVNEIIHEDANKENEKREFEKVKGLYIAQIRPGCVQIAERWMENGESYQSSKEEDDRLWQVCVDQITRETEALNGFLAECPESFKVEVLHAWSERRTGAESATFIPWLEKTQSGFGRFDHGKEKKAIRAILENRSGIDRCIESAMKFEENHATTERLSGEEQEEILAQFRVILQEAQKLEEQSRGKFNRSIRLPSEAMRIVEEIIDRKCAYDTEDRGRGINLRENKIKEFTKDRFYFRFRDELHV